MVGLTTEDTAKLGNPEYLHNVKFEDPTTVAKATLKELNESGLSILLVEQNAFLALKSSNYTYVLENGHISLEGKSS